MNTSGGNEKNQLTNTPLGLNSHSGQPRSRVAITRAGPRKSQPTASLKIFKRDAQVSLCLRGIMKAESTDAGQREKNSRLK